LGFREAAQLFCFFDRISIPSGNRILAQEGSAVARKRNPAIIFILGRSMARMSPFSCGAAASWNAQ
jgi:hypothetical protein